jgi:hypothetical protein
MSSSSGQDFFLFDRQVALVQLLTEIEQVPVLIPDQLAKISEVVIEFNHLDEEVHQRIIHDKEFRSSLLAETRQRVQVYKETNWTCDDWEQEAVDTYLANNLEEGLVDNILDLRQRMEFQTRKNCPIVRRLESQFRMDVTGDGSLFLQNFGQFRYVRSTTRRDHPEYHSNAARWGHSEVFQSLSKTESEYALGEAAKGGHFELLKDLFARCSRNKKKRSLHYILEGAAEAGRQDIIDWTLDMGNEYEVAMFFIGASYSAINAGHHDLAKRFYRHVIADRPNVHFFWIHHAIDFNRIYLLEWFQDKTPIDFQDAFVRAAASGHVRIVQWAESHLKKPNYREAMRRAIFDQHLNIILYLQTRHNFDRLLKQKFTEYMTYMITHSGIHIIRWLMVERERLSTRPYDFTPLFHLSIRSRSLEISQLLLSRLPQPPDLLDVIDEVILHHESSLYTLQWLIIQVSEVDYVRLHILAQCGRNKRIIAWLEDEVIASGAQIVHVKNDGQSKRTPSVIRMLRRHNKSIPWIHLFEACHDEQMDALIQARHKMHLHYKDLHLRRLAKVYKYDYLYRSYHGQHW